MLRAHVVPGINLAVLALPYAPLAHAVDKTTRWYSINVQPATEASPRLFLTNGRKGVTLERYRSGDPTQMWAATQPDYPNAPVVEGEGFGLIECVLQWGCPFEGHGGALVRFVNRASGGCLMVGGRGAYVAPCDSPKVPRQKWQLIYSPSEMVGSYSPIIASGGDISCLSATAKDGEAVAGGVLQPQGCGQHWSQNFTLLVSAEVSCSPAWEYKLCFVEGQN